MSPPGAQPCRAETRSQGIATGFIGVLLLEVFEDGLQSRDPFSGDCDAAHPRDHCGLHEPLAEPRPVLRGLRRDVLGDLLHDAPEGGLQSRDPFSGDCDA